MRRKYRLFALVAALTLIVAACGGDTTETTEAAAPGTTEAAAAYAPTSPECVAPSGAGGGWDFTCRTIGLLFEEMGLTGNVVVTNQEGGGGGVAFADIAENRNRRGRFDDCCFSGDRDSLRPEPVHGSRSR